MSEPARPSVPWEDVVAATMDGTAIIEGGTVVHANDRLAQLHGYADGDDLVGEPWQSLVTPADRRRIEQEILPRIREDGQWVGEIRGQCTDGSGHPLKVSIRQTEDGPLVMAAREFKQEPPTAEPDGADRDRFRRLFDTAPVPIGVFSAAGDVRHCNREAVDFLGAAERGDVVGRHVETFVREEDRDRVRERLRRTIEDREPTEATEERVIGLDGEERVAEVATAPVTVDGEPAAQVVLEDVTERIERERELERYETIVETVEDGVYAVDEDLQFSFVNDGFCGLFDTSREEIVGAHGADLYVDDDEFEDADELREQLLERGDRTGTIHGTYPTSAGERIFESRYRLHPEPDDEFRGSVGIVRDVTEREERQRALERQRDELATFDRINALLFDVIDALVETSTREAVEETACERLADSDLYRFAWTGEKELGGDRIRLRTVAGDDGGYLESIVDPAEGTVPDDGPADRAMRTGDVHVTNVDSPDFEPWRREALEQGLESVVAVPLGYRETVYGVLVVYATRPDAFSEREQRGFGVLGETIGYAINAIKRRRLLFADAVTELEFRLPAPGSFLAAASERYGCRLVVSGHVSADDRWILYVDVEGATAERIVEGAADEPTVEQSRVLEADGEPERLEMVVSGRSLIHRAVPTGVGVRSLQFVDGTGRVVVDAPSGVDARDVVEQFDATFGSVELVARHERDRPPDSPDRPVEPIEALTDRQCEALEAAYRAGYFGWPRTSTGEDVADALGVTASTFHAHLRKAEARLLAWLFD